VLYADGLAFLAQLCLLVYCVLDVLRTPSEQVRNLPKPVWLFLCFVPPIIGPICWLLFGRPQGTRPGGLPYKGNTGRFPEYERPGRAAAQNPDDDEAFLRNLRERAEEQRKRAAEQARRLRDEEQPPPV
jgi:Phospholipase_D-nuclease N-terminal